ncbi:ribosome biogenesis regulatory protein homolog [Rhodnius prolixus]|uniref:Ribosome biogenesis regulatory protein n=1 Tax=Rhodnius prolixus TaxID=13249 RepID=R4G3Z0_RHOPR
MIKSNVNVIKFEDTQDPSKKITVNKVLDVKTDIAILLALDTNELDSKRLREEKEAYLKEIARDNTQILINSLWDLPTERYEGSIVAKLPTPTYILPREKPVPVPKPPTKWELYAKEKGIKNVKKTQSVWDDILKKWVPRHGYKKAMAEKEKNWIIEVPDNVDPYTDMFEKKAEQKQEKVAKNEFQRLRNIAKAKKIKVPSMGLPPTNKLSSTQLNSAANIANISTASLGKFQPKSSKEKQLSKHSILQQKKRKLPLLSAEEERKRNANIVDSILKKKPRLDLNKAVNREIHTQETMASENKKQTKKGKKGSTKNKGKGSKKPKAGKGNRQFHKSKIGGRKRR